MRNNVAVAAGVTAIGVFVGMGAFTYMPQIVEGAIIFWTWLAG